MSKATYFQKGESLDYMNTTNKAITAGTIISMISRIGVAGTDILPGQLGSVHVEGVFEMDKADDVEVVAGTLVYFDGTGIKSVSGADTIPAGYAANTALASAGAIMVKLMG